MLFMCVLVAHVNTSTQMLSECPTTISPTGTTTNTIPSSKSCTMTTAHTSRMRLSTRVSMTPMQMSKTKMNSWYVHRARNKTHTHFS